MANIKKTYTASSLPVAFSRGDSIPIDSSLVWYSLEELENYAATSAVAYVGQIVALVDEEGGAATAYIIADENGTLKEVGSATVGDNKTIVLNNNALALKNWGVQYYKWVEGEEGQPGTHVLQVVDSTHPWIAGLEPKVATGADGVLVLEWYQPSTTTIEGVSSIVSTLQTSVESLTNAVGDAEDTSADSTVYGAIAKVKEDYLPLAGGTLTGVLTLSDGGEAASKTHVANAIASAGHLKRLVVTILPAVGEADANTIYMVKDSSILSGDSYKEYMLIDGAFAQIGDTSVNLEPYATKEYADEKVKDVADGLAEHEADAVKHITAAERTDWNAAKDKVDGLANIKTIGANLTLSEAGVLSASDSYQLPVATDTILGGVKVGGGLAVTEDGVASVKVKAENGLSLGDNGIVLAPASASSAGALTSELYTKLTNLPAGAQVNTIEGIALGDADSTLTPDDNKVVTVPVAAASLGLVKSSEDADKIKVGTDGTMELNTVSATKLYVPEEDTLILYGGHA